MISYHSQGQLLQRGLYSASYVQTLGSVGVGSQHLGAYEVVNDNIFSNGLRNLLIISKWGHVWSIQLG